MLTLWLLPWADSSGFLVLSPIIVFYDLDYLGDINEIQIQIQANLTLTEIELGPIQPQLVQRFC